jgi:glycosyltransferase involved in cell wall biosynthesis
MSLVLFFTYNTSLQTWARVGILSREIQLYKRLQPHFDKITFVTYGDANDLKYAKNLDGIEILYNRWRLPPGIYAQLVPVLHRSSLRNAGIFKTNQISGIRAALPAKRWFKKMLIARCGFLLSTATELEFGNNSNISRKALLMENTAFKKAERVVVTTESMKNTTTRIHGIHPSKITVIPNYVDVEMFAPDPQTTRDKRTICFIGRMEAQKNVGALIEAIAGTNFKLIIIGTGPQRQEMEVLSNRLNADVTFVDPVPHTEIPNYLSRASLFIQPSLYEGHPKALIEAMASGTPVIGGNSPGIQEIITHEDTGYLCETSAKGIRDAITSVMDNAALRNRIASNGRDFAVENFSLNRVVELELGLYSSIM